MKAYSIYPVDFDVHLGVAFSLLVSIHLVSKMNEKRNNIVNACYENKMSASWHKLYNISFHLINSRDMTYFLCKRDNKSYVNNVTQFCWVLLLIPYEC